MQDVISIGFDPSSSHRAISLWNAAGFRCILDTFEDQSLAIGDGMKSVLDKFDPLIERQRIRIDNAKRAKESEANIQKLQNQLLKLEQTKAKRLAPYHKESNATNYSINTAAEAVGFNDPGSNARDVLAVRDAAVDPRVRQFVRSPFAPRLGVGGDSAVEATGADAA